MTMVVRVGQKVPSFSLPDSDGRKRALDEFLSKGSVVISFFPFAFSGVCDKEMCTFRDRLGLAQDFPSQVVGISVDSVYTLKVFTNTYNFQFPLLSDFNKKVVKLYGVLHDPWVAMEYRGVAKRSVFLVDGKGVLRYRWITEKPSEEPPYQDLMRVSRKIAG